MIVCLRHECARARCAKLICGYAIVQHAARALVSGQSRRERLEESALATRRRTKQKRQAALQSAAAVVSTCTLAACSLETSDPNRESDTSDSMSNTCVESRSSKQDNLLRTKTTRLTCNMSHCARTAHAHVMVIDLTRQHAVRARAQDVSFTIQQLARQASAGPAHRAQ